jgi:hypothetical protein
VGKCIKSINVFYRDEPGACHERYCDLADTTAYNSNPDSPIPSDYSSDEDPACQDIASSLRNWAAEEDVSQTAVSRLLTILRPHFPMLPLDARTLLRAESIVMERRQFSGGEFAYLGLAYALEQCLANTSTDTNDLLLNFNVDGIPLCKSSNSQFWPILVSISNPRSAPAAVAIFRGPKKPSLDEFVSIFANEVSSALEDGISLNGKVYSIKIGAFCCDAPARAFIKGVKPYNSYDGCDFCVQSGSFHGRVVFDEMTSTLRRDSHFHLYEDHIQKQSPLCNISGIKMISNFPIDYMHLVLLGVVRKMLNFWLSGPLHCRLPSRKVSQISQRLLAITALFPSCFSRRPRALDCLKLWKSTELRAFLLYSGPAVLHSIIPDDIYKHFISLSVAIRLLCCKKRQCHYVDFCARVLHDFVYQGSLLYGKEFLTYNVHGLLHIAEQTKLHGVLDNFSCFEFESFLGKLKRMLRSPKSELKQVIFCISYIYLQIMYGLSTFW